MQRSVLVFMLCMAGASPLPAQVQGQVIKVLSYNIHHGVNNKGELDIQGIANVILATNPDLVALQEVDSATARVKKANQLQQLAEATGMYIYFGKAMALQGGGYGNGILSRYPIQESYSVELPAAGAGSEPRTAAVVTVKLPGDSLLLNFASAHLDHRENPADRLAQCGILLKHFGEHTRPVILAGDMNATPASKEITTLKSLFTDATEKLGPTWPSDKPTQKLDYVLVNNTSQWHVMSATVIEETVASDHRPVICELLLK
ncbi:endonuclease/exonuclease/phosphatase family protein [Chitinophaga sp.]|uniref:endonuclease/exonuclease/phosphatase family protein n=1 Tax=Chitinophaga sp. TaxID=1869181 RepID=UPI0031E2F142